jgi:hypothetical protein
VKVNYGATQLLGNSIIACVFAIIPIGITYAAFHHDWGALFFFFPHCHRLHTGSRLGLTVGDVSSMTKIGGDGLGRLPNGFRRGAEHEPLMGDN